MKKIIFLVCLISEISVHAHLFNNIFERQDSNWTGALTSGYVFKRDCEFKEVYGHGLVNAITADCCYSRCHIWGVGAKISYWRSSGHTTFLQLRSVLQEVPITLYLRRTRDFKCGLELYGSLGGGLIWTKEKSYLGDARMTKGIGELEVGSNYPIWRCLNFTSAIRYLFPKQSHCCVKVDAGGFDLRAGFEFPF